MAWHMARVDYFDDPNAPKANSIVPSVTQWRSTMPGKSC